MYIQGLFCIHNVFIYTNASDITTSESEENYVFGVESSNLIILISEQNRLHIQQRPHEVRKIIKREYSLTGIEAGLQTVTTSGSLRRISTSSVITGGSCLKPSTHSNFRYTLRQKHWSYL